MITSAAVKIRLRDDCSEHVLKCHRHADIFEILYELGYQKNSDYEVIEQGFIYYDETSEMEHFMSRVKAKRIARKCGQCHNNLLGSNSEELYSEELW